MPLLITGDNERWDAPTLAQTPGDKWGASAGALGWTLGDKWDVKRGRITSPLGRSRSLHECQSRGDKSKWMGGSPAMCNHQSGWVVLPEIYVSSTQYVSKGNASTLVVAAQTGFHAH